ncbi:S-layer homology domain-containing protein [Pelosinus fermentans]|uniref:S-layer homology domain-containing protein n=1 Tax=Pelosinus fermentans TaxID=365349 RepID=UPI0002685C0D|nr:S-layer homology domain-containing protein [Pelosinus fermentans]OAM92754.1 S-layer domain-containing protein [Pelosinus fermentans DSM 17108]SDQ55859.1 S-layer homology domain-containing protein [Pelosinus fermentans]
MKKKLVASLAAAMVLGVAGTSFAASNPFVDVPAKHWSYDAVTKLANAGIVDGYGDGTFRGDKTISRYEMAQIVAKAMAHSDQATAEQKAAIDKLSVEFAEELEGLNVRVTKLEKNASTVKVTGEARLRYEDYSTDDKNNGNTLKLRTRIGLGGQINDEWSYYGRLESTTNLHGDGADSATDKSNDTVTMQNAYVKGALFGTTATIGRFDYVPNFGVVMDGQVNGVKIGFGNVVKTELLYGKQNNKNLWGIDPQPNLEVTAATLSYAASKATTLNGGYYQYKNTSNDTFFDGDDKRDVWEVGFKTQVAPNWALKATYLESDADQDDRGYWTELGYKGANKAKVGSYGAWVGYRDIESDSAPLPTLNGTYAENKGSNGGKGYEVGFNYTPALNTVLRVKYVDLKKSYDGADDAKTKFVQAQAEFFF